MTRKKIFLIVQAVLCALIAGLLAAAALRLYFSGNGNHAGELFDHIYTREKAGAALLPVLPLLLVSLAMTVTGIVLGIRDENADKPVRDPKLLRDLGEVYRCAARREDARGTRYLRTAVLALALVLIVLGILNGGLEDVLAKGAAICTECIGLG